MLARISSLGLLLVAWELASHIAGSQKLPTPEAVWFAILHEISTGDMATNLGWTLYRVVVAFVISMILGTIVGVWMGRNKLADRIIDGWVIVLLNLPALVIIVLLYVWAGFNEVAAITAVVLNKLPNTIVTVREGARSFDRDLDEMAEVFQMSRFVRLYHVLLPQLAPYLAAAARSGLSLVWKIVLIVELEGRSNGVGYAIGTAFSLFDVTTILAYAIVFVVVMLAIETLLVQPIERHVSRWRPRLS